MTPSLSISNILQALYEESPTIKMYVDAIADGNPFPYTLIIKSSECENNEKIANRVHERIKGLTGKLALEEQYLLEELLEISDEAMILEEESYDITMFKDDAVVESSRQTVKGEQVEALKDYARFKGYEISVQKHVD